MDVIDDDVSNDDVGVNATDDLAVVYIIVEDSDDVAVNAT